MEALLWDVAPIGTFCMNEGYRIDKGRRLPKMFYIPQPCNFLSVAVHLALFVLGDIAVIFEVLVLRFSAICSWYLYFPFRLEEDCLGKLNFSVYVYYICVCV